jgi:hypothetical protein
LILWNIGREYQPEFDDLHSRGDRDDRRNVWFTARKVEA